MFLTQLKVLFHIKSVTILSFFGRERTRHLSPDSYIQKVNIANEFLRSNCQTHGLLFWKLRGFTNSLAPLFIDGFRKTEVITNYYESSGDYFFVSSNLKTGALSIVRVNMLI